MKVFASGVKALSELVSDSNSEYLLSVVIPEVQKLWERFEDLEERHRSYLDKDWLSLLVDADRKARATRGREKVQRIAAILCNAAEAGQTKSTSDTEDMMRIAMDLSDVDVRVLQEIVRTQGPVLSGGRTAVPRYNAYSLWNSGRWNDLGLGGGELLSICKKLESFGLVYPAYNPQQNILSDEPTAFGLLKRGKEFVEYIQRVAHAG